MEAYLDNAATNQSISEVREMMVHVMEEDFGNRLPSTQKALPQKIISKKFLKKRFALNKMQTKRNYFYIR